MDDQVEQLRHRIIRTISRRVAAGFAVALVGMYAISAGQGSIASVGDAARLGLFTRNVVVAQLITVVWLGASLLMNPLGGRYLRDMASTIATSRLSSPAPGSMDRITELGLPGLRPVASLSGSELVDSSDVYQTADGRVTVVLEAGVVTALSRLTDGRLLLTTDLMVVPCEQLVVNLKTEADSAATLESHLRLAAKLSSVDLGVVPDSPSIVVDLVELERKALRALGPVTGGFLALHGSARPHRLLVAPTRHDLLGMGLRFDRGPQTQTPAGWSPEADSVTPREQSRVAATVRRSTDTMVSALSS